jgi:hypothetical protein
LNPKPSPPTPLPPPREGVNGYVSAFGYDRSSQPGTRLYPPPRLCQLPPRLCQPPPRLCQPPPRLCQPPPRLYQPPGGRRLYQLPPRLYHASAGSEVVNAPPATTPTITACDHLLRLRRNSRRSCSTASSLTGSVRSCLAKNYGVMRAFSSSPVQGRVKSACFDGAGLKIGF